MSLIKCPECNKEISDEASICINCGYPIREMNDVMIDSVTSMKEEKPKPTLEQYGLPKNIESVVKQVEEEIQRRESRSKKITWILVTAFFIAIGVYGLKTDITLCSFIGLFGTVASVFEIEVPPKYDLKRLVKARDETYAKYYEYKEALKEYERTHK